jgi:hypothetical protein
MTDLQRSEILCIPKRRRLVHTKHKGEEGQDVLHLFYGDKEIIFDEPAFLPFGDKLLVTDRFVAEEAMTWSNGVPHEWETVRGMLEALLEQDVLKRVADAAAEAPAATTYPARLGTVPEGVTPRTFSAHDDQCPAITQEAFGRAVDLGNLEVLIPIYRVAHAALDQDGRQVGENNVTPRNLFLDIPTQRRRCSYAGSRYQADEPMNVTALKHMTSRWPELLSLTEQFRQAFFARLPPRDAWLRVGEAHLLTVCTLAATGYVMVRGVDPVPNGQLDPGLAAMFRLIDGVRLVTTELMRETPGEPGCDLPIRAATIAEYAERNAVYYGRFGVCAGPQALIDEYLGVMLGEVPAPIQIEPDVAARVGDMSAALDYGFVGQRVESLVRIFGALQGLLHERLRLAFEGHGARSKLKERMEVPVDEEHHAQLRLHHPLAEVHKLEIGVNRWMFARAGSAVSKDARVTAATADDLFKLDPTAQAASRRSLAEFFSRLPDHASFGPHIAGELAAVAADVFALERRCLRAVAAEQRVLNERLRRPQGRALCGADVAAYTRPRSGPPFARTLGDGLGITVTTDATSTVLRHGDHGLTLND